jgi:hypothetical protein
MAQRVAAAQWVARLALALQLYPVPDSCMYMYVELAPS